MTCSTHHEPVMFQFMVSALTTRLQGAILLLFSTVAFVFVHLHLYFLIVNLLITILLMHFLSFQMFLYQWNYRVWMNLDGVISQLHSHLSVHSQNVEYIIKHEHKSLFSVFKVAACCGVVEVGCGGVMGQDDPGFIPDAMSRLHRRVHQRTRSEFFLNFILSGLATECESVCACVRVFDWRIKTVSYLIVLLYLVGKMKVKSPQK